MFKFSFRHIDHLSRLLILFMVVFLAMAQGCKNISGEVANDIEQSPDKPRDELNLETFVKLLGREAVVSDELVGKLLKMPVNTEVYEDLDDDGDPDILTYIDGAQRHSDARRPMLFRVIDDDDDMVAGNGPDKDNDCYVADWNADGVIDRAVDYWDEDGDGDADRMDLFSRRGLWVGEKIGLTVVEDIGDDDRMWYTRDNEYSQRPCQWLTDFNGDELFSMYCYDMQKGRFVPTFEDPFAHYDIDNDGLAEVTVRCSGTGGVKMRSGRYSFDVDNDTNWLNRRDYDFSFNLTGSQNEDTSLADHQDKLRDGSLTEPRVDWKNVRQAIESCKWKTVILAWDEIDNNVNAEHEQERWHERWEGVGGYGGSVSYGDKEEINKRVEEDADFSGNMQLYFSPVDRRFHLYGAEKGMINLDYDYNFHLDAKILYQDSDKDGFIDTFAYDGNNDGQPERSYAVDPQATFVKCRLSEMTELYRNALVDSLEQNQLLIDAMKAAVKNQLPLKAEEWFINQRPASFYNPEKLLWSQEATRLYQDMIREELFTQLLAQIELNELKLDHSQIERLYAIGKYAELAKLLCKELEVAPPLSEPWLEIDGAKFTKRLRVELANPIKADRPSIPIVISMSEILKIAPDFNPYCFAVAENKKRILIRQYPSQADDLDGDDQVDEIVFCLINLPAGDTQQCFIYYSPEGKWAGKYRKQTHARDNMGDGGVSVGWESEFIGFRSYFGKRDFFGKKFDSLRLDNLGSYHVEADWGMDVLHVGGVPGLGGLSLWDKDKVYRAYNEENQRRCQLSQKMVADGPVRSAMRLELTELKAGEEKYSISVFCSCYANQIYSENKVCLVKTSGGQDKLPVVSAGLVRMKGGESFADLAKGMLCNWSLQDRKIGAIGQAVIAEPGRIVDRQVLADSEELRVRLDQNGQATFFVAGEWEKSRTDQRRLPAHTGPEWNKHVQLLSDRVLNPVSCKLIELETK
ncbi:MAG: DUF4861 family protein [Sedimentisphaerales bacterium]|nr:DUF4861 family protein [Sedimentisphaerales bacterium]